MVLDIRKIKWLPNVFVFADKTNNTSKMSNDHHQKLLHGNVSKAYQKAPPTLESSINLKAKSISSKLKISNRVKRIARTPIFVTLKDHKGIFCSNPMCCLINHQKTNLGKWLSNLWKEKKKLWYYDKLQFNQWRISDAVLKWLNNITDKKK